MQLSEGFSANMTPCGVANIFLLLLLFILSYDNCWRLASLHGELKKNSMSEKHKISIHITKHIPLKELGIITH